MLVIFYNPNSEFPSIVFCSIHRKYIVSFFFFFLTMIIFYLSKCDTAPSVKRKMCFPLKFNID